ncbi:malto-oligosyltrehalose synthase [Cupriavidus taiwanensis]|uniref:malto-oligosyltrehalose synthase n=1 Tax=Cupriavidus taiwanensis TaxID=164546 RepID=UPI000E1084F2|nr:malto-oligosyltrehalose synthase [Cupriavidus taiwanensis]SPA55806.1 transglycosidase, similar to treY(Arthrobacter) Maltooligosyl trehalose synthase, weak Alpha amylase catalytic subdomain [Cupriavidus taiwanensis]
MMPDGAPQALPRATARLQLHPGFTFADAAAVVGYYAALGVSHLYLSPICGARPGSTHGYDVTDFTAVRDELGGEPGLKALAARARDAGLGLIVDIVPNHMAADPTHNGWWRDVLAHGRGSPCAASFDIDWTPRDPALHGKVLLPMLGQSYWDTVVAGELQWVPASDDAPAHLRYFDHTLPLAPGSVDAEAERDGPAWYDATHAEGRSRLHALLERQHYRLAWWRTAAAAQNWRRFFEISDLVGVREEDERVFDAVHALVLRLLREGWIDGVRVDHVDGLADPAGYCRRLRAALDRHAAARPPALRLERPWLVVEKILGPRERLAPDWQVHGTTGYDFMDEVAAVLHDGDGEAPLDALWARVSGDARGFPEHVEAARRQVLERHLVTEFEGAAACLRDCAEQEPGTRDLTRAALRRALAALMAAVPVYRSYFDARPAERDAAAALADDAMLEQAMRAARAGLAPDEAVALAFIGGCLRTAAPADSETGALRRRLQQLMPALAAKAGEDTAFYRYGRLLSRNEVGSDPARLAMPPAQFHARMAARRLACPYAMLATATHDHKRGEDARMRLAVLSEVPGAWADAVAAWEAASAPLLATLPQAPDPGDRLMLYQTLVGAWPMADLNLADDADAAQPLLERVGAWQRKAIREAKRHGNWTCPDTDYEAACEAFLHGLCAPGPAGGAGSVLAQIGQFAQRIAAAGALNSLAQVLVQLTAPGIPDRYQGCEGWDLSLVDPDNRRPPDYARLQARLGCSAGWAHWLAHWRDGRIKQQLVRQVLAVRRTHAALFADGQYSMLAAQGALVPQVLAFARSADGRQAITVVTRLAAARVDPALPRIPQAAWGDTTLNVGAPQPSRWTDALTGHVIDAPLGRLRLREVLGGLPVALLLREP